MSSDDESSRARLRAVFTGTVQGVGFRQAVCSVARREAVAGYVRNEPDGSVLLVAEGPRSALRRVLLGIRGAAAGARIVGVEEAWGPALHDGEDFEIRFF